MTLRFEIIDEVQRQAEKIKQKEMPEASISSPIIGPGNNEFHASTCCWVALKERE